MQTDCQLNRLFCGNVNKHKLNDEYKWFEESKGGYKKCWKIDGKIKKGWIETVKKWANNLLKHRKNIREVIETWNFLINL